MNWPLFFSVFSLVFVAELPDKTAFATLLMATRGRPVAIFLGVASAFLVQTLVAVSFGHLISLLPEKWVQLGAGALFLGFAWHAWFSRDQAGGETGETPPGLSERLEFVKTLSKAFMVVFIAEWGDLTQLATASLAARYESQPFTVFFAALAALWSVTAVAIVLGRNAKRVIHADRLKTLSAAAFASVGFYFIFTSLSL